MIAVSELERFERALKNIEEFNVGVAVKWDSNPRRNRAANEANLGPGFIGRRQELEKCSVWSERLLMVVTFFRVFRR